MQKIARTKMRRGEKSIAGAFGRGIAAALIVQIFLIAIAASLTSGGVAAESIMLILAAACAAVSSFAGAFLCALFTPKFALPLAVGVGVAQMAVNFALGMLLAEGAGFTPVMPAAFIVGAAAAGVFAVVKKGRK